MISKYRFCLLDIPLTTTATSDIKMAESEPTPRVATRGHGARGYASFTNTNTNRGSQFVKFFWGPVKAL
jgi:hypothetical protein